MPSRRDVLALAPAVAALGSLALAPAKAQAQAHSAAASGAQAINSSVFNSEHIKAVTAVTEVFGRSQRTTAAIVEYDTPIRNDTVGKDHWSVADRTIKRAYANDRAEKANKGRNGRFIVLELDPEDEGAVTFSPDVEEPATVMVSQLVPIETLSGQTYAPTTTAVINTR